MWSTKRLLLRAWDPQRDENKFMQDGNNADFMNLMTNTPRTPSYRSDFIKRMEKDKQSGPFSLIAICEKPDPENPEKAWPHNLTPNDEYFKTAPDAIGFFGFQNDGFDFKNRVATFGISIADTKYRGKGYGTEVLEWALWYGFEELNLHKVGLNVYENNVRAMRCYEKVGFVTEGRLRKAYYHAGRWWDIFCMGVLEEEYFEKKRKTLEQMETPPVSF